MVETNPLPTPPLAAYLTIRGAAELVEFYKQAFGATVNELHHAENGRVMHADLTINGGRLMLADEFPEYGNIKDPRSLGGTTSNLFVSLAAPADVDAQIAKAEKLGAKVVMAPEDTFWGARFGMVADPAGHQWAFSAALK